MAAPTIAEMLKFANLQMAAEALYTFKTYENGTLAPGEISTSVGHYPASVIDPKILTDGNRFASRFAPTEATKFAAQWEVVDHLSNTETGFSGTLFKNRANPSELVLSIRSTEFIDDLVRDSVATNVQEIKAFGWAFGQIADMEAWYDQLKASGKLPVGARLDVTGYSLGGHLATAFNLLREEELAQGPQSVSIGQVVTFNGAGVGQLKNGATLDKVIRDFNELRSDPDKIAALINNSDLRNVFQTLSARLKNGEPVLPSDYALLDSVTPDALGTEIQQQQFADEKSRIRIALDRIKTQQTTVVSIQFGPINDSIKDQNWRQAA
jgi:hypothetical protein